jgi:hypothetical protein
MFGSGKKRKKLNKIINVYFLLILNDHRNSAERPLLIMVTQDPG